MGIEKIIDEIKHNSEKEKTKIIESANIKKQEILDSAGKKSQAAKDDMIRLAKSDISDEKNRKLALARLEIRKMILEEKQEILSDVYEKVLSELNNLDKQKFKEFVKKFIQENGKECDKIIVSLKYKNNFPHTGNIKDIEFVDIQHDFVLQKGKIEINFSFAKIVKLLREKTEKKVAEMFFGNE